MIYGQCFISSINAGLYLDILGLRGALTALPEWLQSMVISQVFRAIYPDTAEDEKHDSVLICVAIRILKRESMFINRQV